MCDDKTSSPFDHLGEDELLERGRSIFEKLPNSLRPGWAADILTKIVNTTGLSSPAIEGTLRIAGDLERWSSGHRAFDAARNEVLQLIKISGRSKSQEILLLQLGVAELVAKITYNASRPPDEFDEDSGWWIVPCVKNVLDEIGDTSFSRSTWKLVCKIN